MVSDTGTFALYKGTNSGDPPAWPTGFNLTNSTYILDYNTMTPSINYLYIVEHDVNIDFH
jgi:hypothetical protein